MGRTIKYRTEEQRKAVRCEQRFQRSLRPGAKEARRKENRRAYARKKVIVVPELSDVVVALASEEISEDSLEKHLFVHHSISAAPLKLPGIVLTDTDFQTMLGHPPYPSHIINYASFEKEWPKISAAFHGYVSRTYISEQTKWVNQAASRDRASLASELSKLYQDLTKHWKQFDIEKREYGDELPTEFITFQNQLWFSRRLTWLVADMACLVEGLDLLLDSIREQLSHFQ
ncbi:hypothetical protein H1R20_g4859, partial [Candolleomyces eurysporus]